MYVLGNSTQSLQSARRFASPSELEGASCLPEQWQLADRRAASFCAGCVIPRRLSHSAAGCVSFGLGCVIRSRLASSQGSIGRAGSYSAETWRERSVLVLERCGDGARLGRELCDGRVLQPDSMVARKVGTRPYGMMARYVCDDLREAELNDRRLDTGPFSADVLLA